MGVRGAGVLLVIAGALMSTVLLARPIVPGVLDFLLAPVAHLVVAVGVALLAVSATRDRRIGIVLGAVWGAGWLLLFLREALLLLWILPPAWFGVGDPLLVLGGVAAGIAALLLHRGSALASVGVPRWTVLALAVLSSLFVWFGIGLPALLPGMPSDAVHAIRVGEEVLLALSALGTGILLLARSRSTRRARF